MVGFFAKNLEVSQLGSQLKNAREARGLSLKDVAEKIKIRTIYLQWLESGDYHSLPADVYIRGFLKKYIGALDLDEEAIMQEYENEKKSMHHLGSICAELPSFKKNNFLITSKVLTWVIIFIIILIVGGYFFYHLNFLFGLPKIKVFYPKTDLVIKDDMLQLAGKTDLNVVLTINDKEIYIDKDGAFKKELMLNDGLNIVKVTAKNGFSRTFSVVRNVIKI